MSFDHRDEGTPESDWAKAWPELPSYLPGTVEHALVIAAHPDDESLGAGGLMSWLYRTGSRITVLLATHGEAAHDGDTGPARVQEFMTAVYRLAPGCRIYDVALPDGKLREHAAALEERVTDALADADLIVAPWRGDGHRDHRIAGEVAAAVAERENIALLEYPIWLWHWASPGSPEVPWHAFERFGLDSTALRHKASALAAYESQRSGAEPIIHDGMLEHFERDWETFVRTES